MKLVKKIIFFVLTMLFCSSIAYSVFPVSEYFDFRLLGNGDTLVLNRKHGNLWLGADLGTNLGIFYGNMYIPVSPNDPVDNKVNILKSYNTGNGAGLFGGLFGQYLPPGGRLGGFLKLHFLDYRPNTSETNAEKGDSLNRKSRTELYTYYFNISPGVVYNFGIPYLNFSLGLDFDILLSESGKVVPYFQNSADIIHVQNFPFKSQSFRIGANMSLSYDIFVMDISSKARAFLTPFVSFQGGSKIFTEFNSNRSVFMFRVGVNAQICLDKVVGTTVKFNPVYEEKPAITSILNQTKIAIKIGSSKNLITPQDLVYVKPEEKIKEEVAETPKVSAETSVKDTALAKNNISVQIVPNQSKTFNYAKSNQTNLTKEMVDYLDRVAAYLKDHPKAQVRIDGHSDNQGTVQQNLKRSEDRALKVYNYLMINKKIPYSRLLKRGRSDFVPAARNDTEEGRQKNRRVEIIIVQ